MTEPSPDYAALAQKILPYMAAFIVSPAAREGVGGAYDDTLHYVAVPLSGPGYEEIKEAPQDFLPVIRSVMESLDLRPIDPGIGDSGKDAPSSGRLRHSCSMSLRLSDGQKFRLFRLMGALNRAAKERRLKIARYHADDCLAVQDFIGEMGKKPRFGSGASGGFTPPAP